MFFKRVQNSRDDKKWESRGEQVCGSRTMSKTTLTGYRFSSLILSRSANDGRIARRAKHLRRMIVSWMKS